MGTGNIRKFFQSHSIKFEQGRNGVLRLDSESETEEHESVSFDNCTDYFNYLLPQALMYGMSYDEFWHSEAETFWAYRASFFMKRKYEYEYDNTIAWLNGLYNARAVAVGFGSKFKDGSQVTYFERPIDLDRKENVENKEVVNQNEHNIKSQIAQAQIALMRQEMKNKKEK